MYHIKYLLVETNRTEGCVSITLGYSLFIAFMPSPINNIFIHPVPQSTKRVSSIQKKFPPSVTNQNRCKCYDMVTFVFVFCVTFNCSVF